MKKHKCDCGDKDCRRREFATKRGSIKVIDHFTCGKVKRIIMDYKTL